MDHSTPPGPPGSPERRQWHHGGTGVPEGRRRFSQLLLSDGLITRRDLLAAVTFAERYHKTLPEAVVELGFVSERDSYITLSRMSHLPLVDLDAEPPDPAAVAQVTAKVARRHRIVPFRLKDRVLSFATPNVDDQTTRDLSFATGMRVEPVLACRSQIDRILEAVYPEEPPAQPRVQTVAPRCPPDATRATFNAPFLASVPSSSPIELCHQLIEGAVRAGASDVHIEATAGGAIVRYRVAGILEAVATLPRESTRGVLNRFKVLARADVSTRHRPQDGAFQLRLDRPVDVRLSAVPTVDGETLVLRIIDTHAPSRTLETLGYPAHHVESLRRVLDRPDGLVLVAGPAGTGKTTLLYAALNHLNDGRRTIISVEDPVERRLPGVTQISLTRGTQPEAVLESILRQDPDIVLVDEIRDPLVARLLGQAATTGHLVLSSLHTSDAVAAVKRLRNLGLDTYRVAECLSAVVAQRLARQLCPQCRLVHGQAESRRLAGQYGLRAVPAGRGPGCDHCRQTGYVDRRPVVEILLPDDQLRDAIVEETRPGDLRAMLRAGGWMTMRDEMLELVAQGATSIDEADRLLAAEPADAAPPSRGQVLPCRRDIADRVG